MVMPIAWVLNLDADEELAHPEGYTTPAATARRLRHHAARLRGLVRPGDIHLDAGSPRAATAERSGVLRGRYVGQAWCPTPSALARLRLAGALLPATPPLAVLRRVNHRAFCAQLGQTLEHGRYVWTMEELWRHVERFPAGPWLLKRPHGFSGRGRRRVSFPHPEPSDLRWIATSLRQHGGLQAEPWVTRRGDFAIHGHVDVSGALHLGQPTVQECGPGGEWLRTRLATDIDLETQEKSLLLRTARDTARALFDAGYFGPFGIDAYRWHDDAGQRHFNARSEINARYTMGWHVGIGDWRPALRVEGI